MKIPHFFKIGATYAKVSFKKYLCSDDGYNGCYNKRTQNLWIDSELIQAKRDRVFGHELMEVIKENYGLALSEDAMSCIANGWIEFLVACGVYFEWDNIEVEDDG